ncbi:P-loop containing nucleoside triphosphate hydrolase protein [Boletus edulis BED1]|uniref:RNA helicase n=1 Tax=Boletus edulis BED1 TaxID=1328754 RepID=A0AAD4GGJ6_BOLED|nr:P-loop containing nucleoside triphosphate hydrolase protein [Boletus edulis BED1]
MRQVRERFNARARRSSSGSLKKGKRRQHAPTVSAETADPNAEILVPKSREQKENERKERLVQELAAQSENKVSSKKRKRLEKYIDKKLRQEERVLIFEKLAQTQTSIPTLELQPSSTLGTGKVASHRERLDKSEDANVRRFMDGRSNKRRRRNDNFPITGLTDTENEDAGLDGMGSDAASVHSPDATAPDQVQIVDMSINSIAPEKSTQPTIIGGALRRNPDGTSMAPRTVTRKNMGQKAGFRRWSKHSAQPDPEPESDTSFDSSDSANDTKEDGNGSSSESASDSDSDHDSSSHTETNTAPAKPTDFKTWAMKQLSVAKGYVIPVDDEPHTKPEADQDTIGQPLPKKRKVSRPPHTDMMRGPLGDDLKLPATALAEHLLSKPQQSSGSSPLERKSKVVSIVRPPDVEEGRLTLPIIAEEQPIMESVLLHPVVIICGETGSGKTTQIPQFLFEAGFGDPNGENPGMVGVTQPRRVAATSMATRVAHEMSLTSSRVSYQIRYDATVSPSTTIKFMTDGVLLRELATDFLLSRYSVIIIDEAHERSMNTDILIGVLSRVLKLREQMWKEKKDGIKPLRLIIMSATLRVSDFAENKLLFPSPPPVISVPARQHPVTIHFNRRTSSDYVKETIKKTAKIHSRLPPGGILIFLTGQNEILGICRTLEAKFSRKAIEVRRRKRRLVNASEYFEDEPPDPPKMVAAADVVLEAEDVELGVGSQDLALDVDDGVLEEDPEALDSADEDAVDDIEDSDSPMHIVPLYSLLPSDKQMRVFESPPPGYRLVVVSTNVAETSLTIPGIRYVVDCGRAKERRYDASSCIQSFEVNWISKASAAQRAGRAGRTGPGHCYRLYSSALYEHYFEQFSQPEILRTPIEGVVLQMKSMGIDTVVNFPFPTPPDTQALKKAETVLTHLGAVSSTPLVSSTTPEASIATIGGRITPLGKSMSLFPLAPRYSRMLVAGRQHDCLPYVITIVSIMTVGDPFLHEEGLGDGKNSDDEDNDELEYIKNERVKAKEARRTRRKAFFETQQLHASLGKSTSDIFRILSVVGAYGFARGGLQFCSEHFVRSKAMEEVHKLRAQLCNIVSATFPGVETGLAKPLKPPNDTQLKVLRQLLATAFIDQVAVRKDHVQKKSTTGVQYSTAKGVPYRAMGVEEDVFIHPSSVLSQRSPPDYIIFTEIVKTTKPWLKGLTLVNPTWLSTLGKPTLCTFTKPAKNSAGVLMTIPKFGPDQWELPPIKAS